MLRKTLFLVAILLTAAVPLHADHLHFSGAEDEPGNGKHVVLLSGDEEYRSEEAMPMLAQLLSRQGLDCTVLFALDQEGNVDPFILDSLSHAEALDSADLVLMSIRFRKWKDPIMEKFDSMLRRGTPIVALRTSTHAFNFPAKSPWAKYSYNAPEASEWPGGFGEQILGETWLSHHGDHKIEGCRTVVEAENAGADILNGVGTIFVEADVYEAHPPKDARILLRGLVTETLDPDSEPVAEKNSPPMPVVWTRELQAMDGSGKIQRIVTNTMGAASDLDDENLRRLVINSVFWGLNLEVPENADATVNGEWEPTFYGTKIGKRGLKPQDFKIEVEKSTSAVPPEPSESIALIGGGLGSRMIHFGHFETEMFSRFSEHDLKIRNLCNEGDTPCFRPHAGRKEQFAFPGGEKYVRSEFRKRTGAYGFYPTPDQWLKKVRADTIVAFFGNVSAFHGEEDLPRFRRELEAFLRYTKKSVYNRTAKPRLILVSPISMEYVPGVNRDGDIASKNELIALYAEAMKEISAEIGVPFVDVFSESQSWFENHDDPLTRDGLLLNNKGNKLLGAYLAEQIFGGKNVASEDRYEALREAVMEKNWVWKQDYKVPNGVHVYGERYEPWGPENYPAEIKKVREMTEVRDRAIWATAKGEAFDLVAEDAKTSELPLVETNYFDGKEKAGTSGYLSGEEAISQLNLPEGYKIELFADEKKFPRLANPVQLSFDSRGRLWVSCMPSYPHWKPGDPKPQDSILILEDTDGDGVADKETVFAGDLHLPIGFEITSKGVYVAQGQDLLLLKDLDGDDRYDEKEIVFSGFDDHDTHHAVGAFSVDPSGGIFLSEGVFLHSNVETAGGTVRATNGGFFRFSPDKNQLERIAQLEIPNPWGTVFDDWGQGFFIHTSGAALSWMAPGKIKPTYGRSINARNIVKSGLIRPNSGLEIVSSRHFPDEVQGDLLMGNVIGLQGIRQYTLNAEGTGYECNLRQDLLGAESGNFRTSDLEFAPDGSLYVLDWSNTLIGHMQHNARDPLRDKKHGRVYRITYPERPSVEPAKIAGASIDELLENLKLPELRSRLRSRAELRGRDADEVDQGLLKWVSELDRKSGEYERLLLEAFWVRRGIGRVDGKLFTELLSAKDHRARAAAVEAVRYHQDVLPQWLEILKSAAGDEHRLVRLEAVTAASWLPPEQGLEIVNVAMKQADDYWIKNALRESRFALGDPTLPPEEYSKDVVTVPEHLNRADRKAYRLGHEVFHRDVHCATCHMDNGVGIDPVYPPLVDSEWVTGSEERLIKLVLNGVTGKMEVAGKVWGENSPPMMAFGPMIRSDEELAAVLTYIRNSWGNDAPSVDPDLVEKIREETATKTAPWTADELLEMHPMESR